MTLQEQADRILAKTENYDVRLNAAACVLARAIHQMRDLAYRLPDTEWNELSPVMRQTYIDHAAAVLGRLKPLRPVERPALTLVEKAHDHSDC